MRNFRNRLFLLLAIQHSMFFSRHIRKSAIIGQHSIEVLLIAVLAFGLSYFTSSAVLRK